MPTRLLFAVVCAICGSLPAAAQGGASADEPPRLFILMQGYRAGALSGSGLSSAFDVDVADAGNANPAALGAFAATTLGLAYQFETAIDEGYVAGIGYGPMNGARPQSAALVAPFGVFVVGASYNQRYAAKTDFGCIPVTTSEDPDPELEFCASQESRLETFSPLAAYRTVLSNGNQLAIGLRLGLGRAHAESTIDSLSQSTSAWGAQIGAGVSYRKPGAFGIAAYYESALRVEGEPTRDGELDDSPIGGPTGGGIVGEIASRSSTFSDALPARLGASGEAALSPSIDVGVEVARIFWKNAWDGFGRDNSEAALWTRVAVAPRTKASLGLLWRGRDRWGGSSAIDEFGYGGRAVYFTVGGTVDVDRFRFSMIVADSHLLSDAEQRQTVVRVGASVRL